MATARDRRKEMEVIYFLKKEVLRGEFHVSVRPRVVPSKFRLIWEANIDSAKF